RAEAPEGVEPLWQVPYLPIDPQDIGRTYEAIIRINSQSGKGGVAFVMEREYGFEMPKPMHQEFGLVVTARADSSGAELPPEQIKAIFDSEYLTRQEPLKLISCDVVPSGSVPANIEVNARVVHNGVEQKISGRGNGPINALVKAIENAGWKQFRVLDYTQHAMTSGSAAEAASYIRVERIADRKSFWGVAVDANIELSGLKALISAVNRALSCK
ncbi:MAG: 2-isopropylmalate synthase, partial [Opitutales bacterium]|nr:2-isopropylmalate synthase [Opitutales bacterium]